MIQIQTIKIEDFRGIRTLDLKLNGENFGICGPNGTGKSGVVDAIEFCLTGDITRLSGQGTGALSIKSHGPHVDQREHPEKANVTITCKIPSDGKIFKIHRSVKNPKKVEITPNEADINRIVSELETHPEFALSRREIVKYIITPPGQRSTDVQTLLRLDHIERLRKSFTTFSNKNLREASDAEHNHHQAEVEFRAVLKLDKFDSRLVLDKVNEKRIILGLPVLSELTKKTSFKNGLSDSTGDDRRQVFRKSVAIADLAAIRAALHEPEPQELIEEQKEIKVVLRKLIKDERALLLSCRHSFIKMGLELITEDVCPLCDKPWNAEELREHLHVKIRSAEEIENVIRNLRKNIYTVFKYLSERIKGIEHVIQYCSCLQPAVEHVEIDIYLNHLKGFETALNDILKDQSKVESVLTAIDKAWWMPMKGVKSEITACYDAVADLPEKTIENEAREILIVAQDRYERLMQTEKIAIELAARSTISEKILDHYNFNATSVLESIYDQVANDFSSYYRTVNGEDEEKFASKLTAEPAKLSFDVDFYGRGLFPPGAYHSEGHQDAMGLCLYLALMKHTLGDQFTFSVLDDVLMSVDIGHRREVCRLLKKEFPKTQFILTTHDRIWLQFMKTENLLSRSQSFGGWTVDCGPRIWDDQDIWSRITEELSKNNVGQAAWLLRHYLEYTAFILADNLRAPIEFRGDGHYDLGDLMPNVLKRWCKLLEEGEKSAKKWRLDAKKIELFELRKKAKELISKTNVEQWVINRSVHFNEWANFQSKEFSEVAEAFKILLEHLHCSNIACKSYIYVSPSKGMMEELRCNCGKITINLKTS